jgi:hypothetical protein
MVMKLIHTVLVLLVFALASMGGVSDVSAEPGVIIVNKAVATDSLTAHQIQKLFLGKSLMWSKKIHASPCYLTSGDDLGRRFFVDVLDTSLKKFKKYWLKRVFSGYGSAPVSFGSTRKLLNYVSDHPGGIGVIPQSWVDSLTHSKIVIVDLKGTF